jgi:hypothetical protein
MLHLIPPSSHSNLCAKAIDSITKTHGIDCLVRDFDKCEFWDLDQVLMETTPVVIKNFNPIAFHEYLVTSGVTRLKDTRCWQVLPTTYQECDRAIAEIGCLVDKKIILHFLLPKDYGQWESIFRNISADNKEIIRKGGGNIHLLPGLDLNAVIYTLHNDEVSESLLVGASRLSPEIRADIKKIIETFLNGFDARDLIGS